MCDAKRMVLAVMVICAGFAGVCLAGSEVLDIYRTQQKAKAADKKPPTVMELLGKYAQTRDQMKSYIMKLEMNTTYKVKTSNPHYAPYNGTWKEYRMRELRTDGDRYHLKKWRWGENRRKGVEVVKDDARYNSLLYNGDNAYQNNYSTSYPQKPDQLVIYPRGNKTLQEETLCRGTMCHPAFGYFGGDLNTRIDKLIKDFDVKMQAQSENVNGFSCRIITADTSHGKYKLWFAPENGHSIVKAIKTEEGGDIHNGSPLPIGYSGFSTFEVAKMTEFNGVWIPTEIHFKGKTTHFNGDCSQSESICKINTVILNPDHKASGSFIIDDIRDGANVRIAGLDEKYTWQDGHVVDADGNEVDLKKIVNETKNVGK